MITTMLNRIKYILLFPILLAMIGNGCTKDFAGLQRNPNKPGEVPPVLLFTYLQRSALQGDNAGQMSAQYYVSYTIGGTLDEATYFWQRYSFGGYSAVRNAYKMEQEAARVNAPAYFKGLALFFRAYSLISLTEKLGDIPYSEAMKGDEGLYYPKYDTQKQVYKGCLDELEIANELIPATGSIDGDIIFDGSLLKWKKFVNTYRLKVLMSLSLKTGDPDIDVIGQFRKIMADPTKYPIMTSNDDNAAFKYYDIEGQRHYFYGGWKGETPMRMSNTFGDVLVGTHDPRLFKFFDVPAVPKDLDANVFENYKSIPFGLLSTEMASMEKTTSALDARYVDNPVVEPYLIQSYHDLQFILAEAVVRGWITGNAETYYNNGIKGSCKFYAIPDAEINKFLAGAVKYDANKALEQICIQRWVGYFGNSHWDAVANHRRTRIRGFDPKGANTDMGWPKFNIGTANRNGGRIPYRYMYPQTELDYNARNLADAVARQWGEDNINNKMWTLIPE